MLSAGGLPSEPVRVGDSDAAMSLAKAMHRQSSGRDRVVNRAHAEIVVVRNFSRSPPSLHWCRVIVLSN